MKKAGIVTTTSCEAKDKYTNPETVVNASGPKRIHKLENHEVHPVHNHPSCTCAKL